MSLVSKLEADLSTAKHLAEKREMALRLSEHPDFVKLILREFCVEECARYAQTSGNMMLDSTARADALAMAQAAGYLMNFLRTTIQMGEVAASRGIREAEEALEEARAEEGAE